MAEKYVVIDIAPDGRVTTDMEGFSDNSCVPVSQRLQGLLDAERVSEEPRPEYFRKVVLETAAAVKQALGR